MIKLFRIKEWLLTKILFNLTIGFSISMVLSNTLQIEFSVIVLIILYISSIGSFGYFINDIFDYKADQIVTKKNLTNSYTTISKYLIVIILLALASIPFYYFLVNPSFYFVLLIFQILLLTSYSIPKVKLKTHFIGLIWDSLYSFVLPALITVEIIRQSNNLFSWNIIEIIFPLTWLYLVGYRSILNHQLIDFENDVTSNVPTFINSIGKIKGQKLIKITLILELAFFCFSVWLYHSLFLPFSLLVIFLFLTIELGIKFKTFTASTHIERLIHLLNHFYNYYLFMGMMLWCSWHVHPAYVIIVIVFILYRLSLFELFYFHVLKWFYYKAKGLFYRIIQN